MLTIVVTRAANGSTQTALESTAAVCLRCMSASIAVRLPCAAAAYEILVGHRCRSQRVRLLINLGEEGDESLVALRYLVPCTQCLNNLWEAS